VFIHIYSKNIVGIAPADFNGDGDMDLLVATKTEKEGPVNSQVYFGDRKSLKKCKLVIVVFMPIYMYKIFGSFSSIVLLLLLLCGTASTY